MNNFNWLGAYVEVDVNGFPWAFLENHYFCSSSSSSSSSARVAALSVVVLKPMDGNLSDKDDKAAFKRGELKFIADVSAE